MYYSLLQIKFKFQHPNQWYFCTTVTRHCNYYYYDLWSIFSKKADIATVIKPCEATLPLLSKPSYKTLPNIAHYLFKFYFSLWRSWAHSAFACEVTHHCLLPQIITPIAALYSGLRVMDASLLLQITALFGFLFWSIAAIILKSCECSSEIKKDASIIVAREMDLWAAGWKTVNASKTEKTVCVWRLLFLSLSPLHYINVHVRYVNDLYMYAKLSPTICFQRLHCHDSSKKTSAFPPYHLHLVAIADASVSAYVRASICMCVSTVRVCLCGHVRICVCVREKSLAAVYMEDQGFVWNGVICWEHKSLKIDSFFKLQTLDRPPVPYPSPPINHVLQNPWWQ